MIKCGSYQTDVHIPPYFLFICLIRTTSNLWSHSSLLSLHMFDQNHIYIIGHIPEGCQMIGVGSVQPIVKKEGGM
jgi:hypothetical protein